jgi:hypothetical protein
MMAMTVGAAMVAMRQNTGTTKPSSMSRPLSSARRRSVRHAGRTSSSPSAKAAAPYRMLAWMPPRTITQKLERPAGATRCSSTAVPRITGIQNPRPMLAIHTGSLTAARSAARSSSKSIGAGNGCDRMRLSAPMAGETGGMPSRAPSPIVSCASSVASSSWPTKGQPNTHTVPASTRRPASVMVSAP